MLTAQTLRRLLSCSARAQANAEQRAQLKQLDEDEEYVQVRHTRRRPHGKESEPLTRLSFRQNFPKTEKYVSLFSRGGDEAHADAERARLRTLIKVRVCTRSPSLSFALAHGLPAQANVAAAALLAEDDEGASRRPVASLSALCVDRVCRMCFAGGVDADAGLPDDAAEDLEEDEFFAGAGAGGAAAGHRFFGDGGGAEEPQWRTNELYAEEEDADDAHRPQSRAGRQSTGTPRGGGTPRDGPRSPQWRKGDGGSSGGAGGRDAAAGRGKRKLSGDGGRDGAPAGKRPRPEAPARKSWADAGPQRPSWGGGGGGRGEGWGAQKKAAHGAAPMPHKAAPLRIPASAAAPKQHAPAPPRPAPPPKPEAKQPLRSRAEGGRKRRPKK